MRLISHRGNINGKILENENKPNYIDDAIKLGFDVEVDIWVIEGSFYLGHDEPQYGIFLNWLFDRKDKLWIHCKNIESVEWFNQLKDAYNYFWHEHDTLTLTSKGYIWAYPGYQPISGSIAVLPEQNNEDTSSCVGICSDFIENYSIF